MLVKYFYETTDCKMHGVYLCDEEDFIHFIEYTFDAENSDVVWVLAELPNGYGIEYHCSWESPRKIIWKKSLAGADFDDPYGYLRDEF